MRASALRSGRRLAVAAAAAGVALATASTASAAITLSPASQTRLTGQTASLTATALTVSGAPFNGAITFSITSGPNAGMTANVPTNPNNGQATFTYSSTKAGTDHITASFNNSVPETSGESTVTWSPPVPPKTDVGVALAAPSLVRVGQRGTWTATLRNAGPDTATGIVFKATVTGGASLVSATASQGAACSGSTCPVGTLASGASATVTLIYAISQPGGVTVNSTVESDFDTNTSNNASSATATALAAGAPPPPPPPPSQPGIFNAIGTGTVIVDGKSQPADQQFQLESGDAADVTNGSLTFTAADGSSGTFSATQPTSRRSSQSLEANLPAQFTVSQPATGGTTTLTLTGGDLSSCGSKRSASAVSKKPVRALWGSAKGNFTTKGRYAAATVRGTIWLVEDRCDATLTQVVDGVVAVQDLARKKTVTVNAGGSYLAAPVVPLKVPAQSPALVQRRGLLYGGRIYKTKKAYTRYLVGGGHTWAEFAGKYPKLAAALAKRR